jgi:hypothetical protein
MRSAIDGSNRAAVLGEGKGVRSDGQAARRKASNKSTTLESRVAFAPLCLAATNNNVMRLVLETFSSGQAAVIKKIHAAIIRRSSIGICDAIRGLA